MDATRQYTLCGQLPDIAGQVYVGIMGFEVATQLASKPACRFVLKHASILACNLSFNKLPKCTALHLKLVYSPVLRGRLQNGHIMLDQMGLCQVDPR